MTTLLDFLCEKRPATGSKGMVVTNHPLASLAGTQILLEGGNAVDAAIASLFALCVVEPMMVGPLGGGVAHIRLADGRHTILDGLCTAPSAATSDMFSHAAPGANEVGPLAFAVPGALAGWCTALARFGTAPLEDVMAPAIRLAERGFTVTPYLSDCVTDTLAELAHDPDLATTFIHDGAAIPPGTRLKRPQFGATLRLIARQGPSVLHGGLLGDAVAAHVAQAGGVVTAADLASVRTVERVPVRGQYRGYDVYGPPPPSSGGAHIAQMLNILEGYDVAALGFGTVDGVHLLAEAMKIAFADRAAVTADPDFVDIPLDRLVAKDYAAERRAAIDMGRAQEWGPGVAPVESANTTHVTVADAAGNVVATTQTINGLFGAKFSIPGTGLIANNYMLNFDPAPGRALSVAPGKRVFTSMAPMLALRDGKVAYALGLPGGLRIFGSALQALVNLIDHGMAPQFAVEAPRMWTMGGALELEPGISDAVAAGLAARGHDVKRVRRIAGGMGAIAFEGDGMMTGAACWRADGTPIGVAGGLARAGVRFSL
jgi:gamma-glutamyltranspeptidase/glutathione hydrolase